MQAQAVYTDADVKKLLQTVRIVTDTREQNNKHITDYLNKRGIDTESRKLDVGDYAALLPADPSMGIVTDMLFPMRIERKNSIDELASSIKDRTRFESELIRSGPFLFSVMVEDEQGFSNMLSGNYRSEYQPQALIGSLQTFESRYGFNTVYIGKQDAGAYLYTKLLYHARNAIKSNY
ncbi:hypothetical protein CHL76_16460 [Marinococcus halophilus]|nr:ERCC4 domain-containing protein [Marinococcus halophilus]OZT78728.1 hypothetical protein CHL76_16460 [Marinococcus halophilus]